MPCPTYRATDRAEAEEAAEEKEEGQGQQGGAGGFLGQVATGPAIPRGTA